MFGLVTDRSSQGRRYKTGPRWHPVPDRNGMTPCGLNAAAFPAEAFGSSDGRVACAACCPVEGTPATNDNPTLFDLPPTPELSA